MSSKTEYIILVDPDDNKIGEVEKLLGHQYAMLHRAFSVLIFREINGNMETLLQQRSKTKYHGGGLWTNTCCSHPRSGEDLKRSAENRLKEEMGISTQLTEVGKFHYVAKLDNGITENEIDHVFIGTFDADVIQVNPEEVEDYKWVEVNTLREQMAQDPNKYTPWFAQALAIALTHFDLPPNVRLSCTPFFGQIAKRVYYPHNEGSVCGRNTVQHLNLKLHLNHLAANQ